MKAYFLEVSEPWPSSQFDREREVERKTRRRRQASHSRIRRSSCHYLCLLSFHFSGRSVQTTVQVRNDVLCHLFVGVEVEP